MIAADPVPDHQVALLEKSRLRRELKQARARYSANQRQFAADQLLRRALKHGLLQRYRRIGFYIPMPSEIDLLPLINQALWMGCECYLPVVPPARNRLMRFTRIHADHAWYLNRYRIPEIAAPQSLGARQLDLIFVPLVGVDQEGFRLGMGGGFYDTTLAFRRLRSCWKKPVLIGAAFDCQRVSRVPREPWDMPLDFLLTESTYTKFRHNRAK
ncbi:5-formyltetrahydrofolate cyclo-ligase [Chitinivorax tropicus]|uniref:5-formyltetrahydrofolate cyclo-ligase n=1 Tax=Chitinivorax tropicus TaxID=714531 RepID=A0A840MF67_9PROT|nr:5-formyltetrahydrofolate cyclo-ligase [Chitinivorax tropicus]MBB5017040.1 5-formyltetrahydrofolate cyclo-ligase [Chitinivorax tropicus]